MEILAIGLIVSYLINILALFFFGMHTYVMLWLYKRNQERCKSDTDPEYPTMDLKTTPARRFPVVTIQLPIFNEYYVVERLISAATELKWPRKKLEIQVLDDSTDETVDRVAGLVRKYRKQGFDIKHVHRTSRKGHKAGALREGLEKARGNFIGVFDADFIPDADFLLKCMSRFEDPEIGMVQTRWGHINGDYSMLTRAQAVGIDGHFVVEQVARNGGDLWMNFNGTGGIWRRQCIMDAGNWQSDTLTEDFDLSYRAELAGWKFQYFMDVVNPAEVPATVTSFKSQQFRWCKGSIQTAVKLIPRILKSKFNWKIKAEAIIHLLNYSVHPLMIFNIVMLLPMLTLPLWSSYSMESLSLGLIFGGAAVLSLATFAPMVFYIYSQRVLYQDWLRRILWLPFLMMIGTGVAINNTRAYLEALLGIKSSFKRTPKLKIESKSDRPLQRLKYRQKLDIYAVFEIMMGLYCVLLMATSVWLDRSFLIPFLSLYAIGFFYIGIGSFLEAYLSQKVKTSKVARDPETDPTIPANLSDETPARAAA